MELKYLAMTLDDKLGFCSCIEKNNKKAIKGYGVVDG